MIKLNPCRVCGKVPVMRKAFGRIYYVSSAEDYCGCFGCGMQGKLPPPTTEEQAAAAWNAANPSTIPCCKCGGPVVEFTVPNDIWNAVIRRGGHETDQEYLCMDCWYKALRAYLADTQPNLPLTLQEAHDYGINHPDDPIYIEHFGQFAVSGYEQADYMRIFKPQKQASASYGVTWRAWPRKPSTADIAAARAQKEGL
jgi:hypothetical protein